MADFLRELIRPAAELPDADVCLVGLPLDFGTVLEGGRAGAAHAPNAIRAELRRYHKTYNTDWGISLEKLRIADAGNLDLKQPDHTANHQRIRARLGELCRQYPRVVVLGGSHDGTYSTVRGLFDATGQQPTGGLNIDAHADVKDRLDIGSGTPFGKLLREGFLAGENFAEVGLHSNLTTKEDQAFLRRHEVKVIRANQIHRGQNGAYWVSKLLQEVVRNRPVFVSFDIDCVASAYAPGVSAPSPLGLTPSNAVLAAFAAGKFRSLSQQPVRLFEVVELNPFFDRDQQTARLAATIVAAYLTGVAASLGA
ncbi:arginase family protein [Hymenobacter lapidiphilus]|uniref:Formimidoylglutamase n=1 Tax=Hymenobacter lapidiphilus TaxID=2608003 RepID=A0A7Y7U760_9BACT|nr:formimidoylglutamase [Hymenobacter lapidiphilus]NVO32175.1 formimidoylglutamase [Hymenobacter lapidiphilus]